MLKLNLKSSVLSIATSTSSSDAVSVISQIVIDVKVDLLSWVILGVNNDFEAPLHTAST